MDLIKIPKTFDFDFRNVAVFQKNGRFSGKTDSGRRSGGDDVAGFERD